MANQKKGGVTPAVTIDDIFGNKKGVKINWMALTPESKIDEICADANLDEKAKAAIRILISEELKQYIDDISRYVINEIECRELGRDYSQRVISSPINQNPMNPWNQNPMNPMNEFPQLVTPFQLQKPKQYALERLETLARALYSMDGFDEAAIVYNCIAEIIKCKEDKR